MWTADTARGVDLARRITSGAAFVDAVVASDPRLPFGSTKLSGHGRELAAAGIRDPHLLGRGLTVHPNSGIMSGTSGRARSRRT
ncbi:hypothetical protein ACFWJ5_26715 [Streptomyces qaidamensis]|uniref:hypothetical protein n=1 Tax=Streptomyces qaidamensis TaxID=1783515 RepID=UPI00364BCF9B